MKKLFLGLIILIAGVFIFNQCDFIKSIYQPEADTLSYTVKLFEKEYGDCANIFENCASIKIQYPEFDKKENQPAIDSVNGYILTSLLTPIYEGEKIDSLGRLLDDFLEEYIDFRDEFPNSSVGWSDEKIYSIFLNKAGILSLEFSEYSYMGGAHPNGFKNYINFDIKTGNPIKLSDIFKDGYVSELTTLAEKKFRKVRQLANNEGLNQAGFWFENNKFKLNNNFVLTDESIIFYFNQYEIAPYALGPTKVELYYRSLDNLFKDDSVISDLIH